MRKLRHQLLASLFCSSIFLGCALAQSVLTPIRDTVLNSDSSLFSGTIAVTWNGPLPSGETESQLSATARVYNGALSLILVPNTSGTTYQAVYTSSDGTTAWTETWDVPASATPLKLTDIRVTGGSSGGSAEFVDAETPAGTPNGTTTVFTLTKAPAPAASLELYRNGVLQRQGVDYTLSGNTVTFVNASIPQTNDLLQAFYRNSGTATAVSFADAETPSGSINGTNLAFTLADAPNPALSLRLYKNGILLLQNTDYTLSGSTITFSSTSKTPHTGDSLIAFYRY
ncbi:MAG TPA: hypothetical protein VF283_10815 [Bryobacteraceae bacterium]